jgi:molybdopterin-guanine dinucleotide biosynthesis protein
LTILWIGGAADAGKTTLARGLAERLGCELYEYDRTDAAHHEALAAEHGDIRAFMAASLDARWVEPTPEELYRRAMRSFRLRWPLVLRELAGLAADPRQLVVVEGFGLLPDLVRPLMNDLRQGLWLVPTDEFKRGAWRRRGKPSWAAMVADPDRGAANLWVRDAFIADEVARQARAMGLALVVNDGALFASQLVELAAGQFAPFLRG